MLKYIQCLLFQKTIYYVQRCKGTVVYSIHELLHTGEVLVLNDHHVAYRFSSRWKVVLHVVPRVLPTEQHVLVTETPPLRQGSIAILWRVRMNVVDDTRLWQHLKLETNQISLNYLKTFIKLLKLNNPAV